MNIAQVLHKGQFNTGSVHQMYQLSRGLAGQGHRVMVIGRGGTELETRCAEDGLVYHGLPFRNEWDFGTVRELVRIFRENEVQVVHVHKGLPHTLALWASFFVSMPVLVANRGVSFPLTIWNRGKYRSRRCSHVVCVCDAIREIVIRSGKLPRDKVTTVYAGTDLTRFDPDRVSGTDVRRKLGFSENSPVICQVGLREWRGWKTLVQAFGMVTETVPDARLLLVAARNDEHRREIMDCAAGNGVADQTTVLGYRSDMPEISAAMDIGVDLSYEGLGITGTLREGMAMRKAIVCSSAGGNPELVLDGVTGIVVPPDNPELTAKALSALLNDRPLRETMGKAGRARVESGFSSEHRIRRIQDLYSRLLKKGMLS